MDYFPLGFIFAPDFLCSGFRELGIPDHGLADVLINRQRLIQDINVLFQPRGTAGEAFVIQKHFGNDGIAVCVNHSFLDVVDVEEFGFQFFGADIFCRCSG